MKLYGHDLSELLQLKELLASAASLIVWLITRKRFAKFWAKWSHWVIAVSSGLFVYGLWSLGCLDWLASPVHIPLWVAVLCAVPVMVAVWLLISLTAEKLKIPTSSDYRTDQILGIQWRWDYYHGVIEPDLIHAFCPRLECQCRLDVEQVSVLSYMGGYEFVCPNCGFKKVLDGPEEKIRRRVAVEIERRIRTGEFANRNR